jgi:deazaflavin-dependent oxidoreductase (nitroreductase family)
MMRAMTDGLSVAEFNKHVIESFRASGGIGELGPVHFDRLVLLTTTGRRSGESRTVPLGCVRNEADELLLFASNMGAAKAPDWFHNIVADPHVTIEITGETREADAVVLRGEARDAAYDSWIETMPGVADHQETAGRLIPMICIPPA